MKIELFIFIRNINKKLILIESYLSVIPSIGLSISFLNLRYNYRIIPH